MDHPEEEMILEYDEDKNDDVIDEEKNIVQECGD